MPNEATTRLELEATFGAMLDARVWVGPRPAGDADRVPHALAEAIGYPRPLTREGEDAPFLEIDARLAAITLAKLATQSQAYGFSRPPPDDMVRRMAKAIAVLGPHARYFCNANHDTPWVKRDPPVRSGPGADGPAFVAFRAVSFFVHLSEATFDTGVVGVGDEVAFIVWGEDED